MTQTRPEPKVIIIPAKEESPQDQEKKKNLRVAAYCRVSTKKDEQLGSYENQKAYYTEKIMEFPIVKDTTPNMMNPRLYTTSYNKPQGQQFDDTAVLSFIKLQYT